MENSSGKKELATWILTATSKFRQLTISAASGNCVSLLENTPENKILRKAFIKNNGGQLVALHRL